MLFEEIKTPFKVKKLATDSVNARVSDADGLALCEITGIYGPDGYSPYIADENKLAHLFAAAPELLEALECILKVVNVRIDDPRIKQFDAARAAIAKAYGNQ